MSIMKDIGNVFLKYSEQVINKTDSLTQMAKINIDIKKSLSEIEDAKTRIGNYITDQHESGTATVMLNDTNISADLKLINELKSRINEWKKTLEEIKKKKTPQDSEEEPGNDNTQKSDNI